MLNVSDIIFKGKGAFLIVLSDHWVILNAPGATCLFYLMITCLFSSGVLNMSLPLSSQPKYGDWKIQVRGYVSYLYCTATVPTLQNRLLCTTWLNSNQSFSKLEGPYLLRYSPNHRPHGFPASTGTILVERINVHRPWMGDRRLENSLETVLATGSVMNCAVN